MDIEVRRLTQKEMDSLGIKDWPIWEKEESTFDWYYDSKENCFFLEGEVDVHIPGKKPVTIKKGDFASFPKGLKCKWHIKKKVKKHYNFE